MTVKQHSYQAPVIVETNNLALAQELAALAAQAGLTLVHEATGASALRIGAQRWRLDLPVYWPDLQRQIMTVIIAQPSPLALDSRRSSLCDADTGVHIALTALEYTLLERLMQAAAPVSRAALMQQVWGQDSTLETHALESHIYRLRQKLQQAGIGAHIRSDSNGYEFVTLPRSVTDTIADRPEND